MNSPFHPVNIKRGTLPRSSEIIDAAAARLTARGPVTEDQLVGVLSGMAAMATVILQMKEVLRYNRPELLPITEVMLANQHLITRSIGLTPDEVGRMAEAMYNEFPRA